MHNTAIDYKRTRVLNENSIYSIKYNTLTLDGTSNLSPRARRYLAFFVSVVKMGYRSISCRADVMADAIYRAQGQTKSVRTLSSAIRELESHGFMLRRTNRIGEDNFKTIITINAEKFTYWTKEREKNVIPLPTTSHISPYRQTLPRDDCRNESPRVNSQYSYSSENNKPRAHTRNNKHAKKFKFHPIIYTLMMVLRGKPDKTKLVDIAHEELSGQTSRAPLDWKGLESRWQAMPIMERDGIARADIIPVLRCIDGRPHENTMETISKPSQECCRNDILPVKQPTRDEIRELLSGLSDRVVSAVPDEPPPKKDPGRPTRKDLLSFDEMSILGRAKKAIEYKR